MTAVLQNPYAASLTLRADMLDPTCRAKHRQNFERFKIVLKVLVVHIHVLHIHPSPGRLGRPDFRRNVRGSRQMI